MKVFTNKAMNAVLSQHITKHDAIFALDKNNSKQITRIKSQRKRGRRFSCYLEAKLVSKKHSTRASITLFQLLQNATPLGGICKIQDAHLFKYWYTPNLRKQLHKTSILNEQLWDSLSRFEWTINKLHIEDFVHEDVFWHGYSFIHHFEEYLQQLSYPLTCIVTLSLQIDTPRVLSKGGEIVLFSFHKKRAGEYVINPDEIEKYQNPLLLCEISNQL